MLTLNRAAGQRIYIGQRLYISELEESADWIIDFLDVSGRVGDTFAQVLVGNRNLDGDIHTLTMTGPDVKFGPNIGIALLRTIETAAGVVARVGINAPRHLRILRCDAHPVAAVNKGRAVLP